MQYCKPFHACPLAFYHSCTVNSLQFNKTQTVDGKVDVSRIQYIHLYCNYQNSLLVEEFQWLFYREFPFNPALNLAVFSPLMACHTCLLVSGQNLMKKNRWYSLSACMCQKFTHKNLSWVLTAHGLCSDHVHNLFSRIIVTTSF